MTLRAKLPVADRGGQVVGLVIEPRFAEAQSLAHQNAEGGISIGGAAAFWRPRAAGSADGTARARRSRTGADGPRRAVAQPGPGPGASVRYALDGITNGSAAAEPADRWHSRFRCWQARPWRLWPARRHRCA